jgi:hypothetical protein
MGYRGRRLSISPYIDKGAVENFYLKGHTMLLSLYGVGKGHQWTNA